MFTDLLDENGRRSMVRFLALLVVSTGLLICVMAVLFSKDDHRIGLSLVALGLAGKIIQKPFEKEKPNADIDHRP